MFRYYRLIIVILFALGVLADQAWGAPSRVSFDSFEFPSRENLLNEVSLLTEDPDEVEAGIDNLVEWINGSLPMKEKAQIIEQCTKFFDKPVPANIMTSDSLPCLAWLVENERQNLRFNPNLDAEEITGYDVTVTRDVSTWHGLEDSELKDSLRVIQPKTDREFEKYYKFFLSKMHDCRYLSAIGAFMLRMETRFGDGEEESRFFKLYESFSACPSKDVPVSESIHRKVGLLFLLKGNKESAKQALIRSLDVEDPKERFRSLFWLGAIEQEEVIKNQKREEGPYWKSLFEEYPLSYHTIVASHAIGRDPFGQAVLSQLPQMEIVRRNANVWTPYNAAAFVFELLIAMKQSKALDNWSKVTNNVVENADPETTLYLILCHQSAGNYLHSFRLVSKYIKDSKRHAFSLRFVQLAFPMQFEDLVFKQGEVVDPLFVMGLIRQESAFSTTARSRANARGLMQLLPSTARLFEKGSPQDLYNPEKNVRVGTLYLARLMRRYKGQAEYVLAAYNAGDGKLDQWLDRYKDAPPLLFADLIPYPETRNYIAIIFRNVYWYGRLVVLQDKQTREKRVARSANAMFKAESVQELLRMIWAGEEGVKKPPIAQFLKTPKEVSTNP